MGIAQAGIVFRPSSPSINVESVVADLFGAKVVQIEHPNIGQFDIRNAGDVMVQRFENTYFFCSDELAWDLLEFPKKDAAHLYRSLGFPQLFMAFCHYDSGGSHGYAFFEDGKRTRSRLQRMGREDESSLIEFGAVKDFEHHWLSADFYIEDEDCPVEDQHKIYFLGDREIEVSEYDLTKRLLEEGMVRYFGLCPWLAEIEPDYYFFKILEKRKRSWWQFWKA